jgi:hypothetical protein
MKKRSMGTSALLAILMLVPVGAQAAPAAPSKPVLTIASEP